jgi:hypothetical protein
VNDEFVKKYRYRDKHIKCCAICGHHWNNRMRNKIMCDGSFTKEGVSITVNPMGVCKMYFPDKQEAGNGNC